MTVESPTLVHPSIPPVPNEGGVVRVRGSLWAVATVREQGLGRSSADEGTAGLQHVVSLESLDEDRMGETLDVVWELEIGHALASRQDLPGQLTVEGFDDPNTLGAFVDAIRWGAVTAANPRRYQAPFRSGANVEAYQLEPLRRALQAPRANLLLADDVGLGKTIEAGLVIQELLLRHRARSAIIVCPPSLMIKWRDEMREKFGLHFVIVNSELLATVRRSHGLAANPFTLFPRLIVSMAWLPQPRAQRLLRGLYAETDRRDGARRNLFDILVVDEAHHVAPSAPTSSRARSYAIDSQRTRATRELARRCEHRLFLSATPHNGYTESFTALLEMVDDQRFSRGAALDEKALSEVTVRRLKRDIPSKGFQERQVRSIPFEPSEEEQRRFDDLTRILEVSARAHGNRPGGDLVSMLVKRRFLSSPWAFGRTLAAYLDSHDGRGLVDAAVDDYTQELLGLDQSDEEEGLTDQPEFQTLQRSRASDPLVAGTGELEDLVRWGLGHEFRSDERLDALVRWLDVICRVDDLWLNERVVVFTEFADTMDWIVRVLERRGYAGRVLSIDGSTDVETRELIRQKFAANPSEEPVRVLVATDAAGEGVDLQARCHRLVNFDIPFNPTRIEQRIGRIDRYGQEQRPEIYQLVPARDSSTYDADLHFLRRVVDKVAAIQNDLGSVNQVVLDHFSVSRRGRASLDTISARSSDAIASTLAGGLKLNADLTRLSQDFEAEQEAMHLRPFNAARVVQMALRLADQPPLTVTGDQDAAEPVYEVGRLGPRWQTAVEGLTTALRPTEPRPITFHGPDARGRSDLVHVHLGHPLMQKASRLLRSSLFSSHGALHRVTAVVASDLPDSCVAVVGRLVLVGQGGVRLHEEVVVAGVRLAAREMRAELVEDALDHALDHEELDLVPPAVREHLVDLWNADGAVRERLARRLEQVARNRQQRVEEDLETRLAEDRRRAREIFAEFRANLRSSLATLADEQETLFSNEGAEQRRRDIRTMERRLDSLDEELTRELAAIETRYAGVAPHVSAAALVFALTPEDAESWGSER